MLELENPNRQQQIQMNQKKSNQTKAKRTIGSQANFRFGFLRDDAGKCFFAFTQCVRTFDDSYTYTRTLAHN